MVEQGKRGYPGKMCVVAHRRKLSVGCGLAIYSGRARANSSVTKHLSSVTLPPPKRHFVSKWPAIQAIYIQRKLPLPSSSRRSI